MKRLENSCDSLPWNGGARLINLWELMKSFKAETLFQLGRMSGSIDGIVMASHSTGRSEVLDKDVRENLSKVLEDHIIPCKEANLKISVLAIEDLQDLLGRLEKMDFGDTQAALNEVSNTVRRELSCTTVFCLNPGRKDFYQAKNLFGDEVATNFASTTYDIEEAGNCLATERATAAVFHSVRIIEVGLRAVGKTLNEQHLDPNRNPTWEAILTRCDAELKKPRKDRSPDWQTNEGFYVEATARLRSVKDAWRNPTMHVDKKYTPDEAQDIYNAVRTFMQHLATKLKE